MKMIRRKTAPISILMTIIALLLSVQCRSVQAALIDTETALNPNHMQSDRQLVKSFLARSDVQQILVAQGLDPLEAQMRVDSLTDSEISAIKDKVANLPPGGGVIGLVLIVLVIVLLVIVIMRLI